MREKCPPKLHLIEEREQRCTRLGCLTPRTQREASEVQPKPGLRLHGAAADGRAPQGTPMCSELQEEALLSARTPLNPPACSGKRQKGCSKRPERKVVAFAIFERRARRIPELCSSNRLMPPTSFHTERNKEKGASPGQNLGEPLLIPTA